MAADPQAFLPLHPLELRILLVLLEGATHGYEIVQRIEETEGAGPIYPANLYRRIRDLLGAGLLMESDAPAAEEAHARRRYLSITPLGRRVARAEAHRLQELLRDAGVRKLLRPKEV